jgi:hypothetical protein
MLMARTGAARVATEVLVLAISVAAATWGAREAWHRWGPRGEWFRADPRVQRTVTSDGRVTDAIDSDGDLVVDMWTVFDGDRLTEMVFDDDQDGRPDRRRTFSAEDGASHVESLAGENEGIKR